MRRSGEEMLASMPSLPFNGSILLIQVHRYATNGRIRIDLFCPDQDRDDMFGEYATLSINVPEIKLALNEFIVPVRGVSPDLLKACLASPHFEDTGRRVRYGYVYGDPVWRYKS